MNINESLHIYLNKKEGFLIDEQERDENNCLFDLIC
jgi:hypothetical protein